MRIKNLNYNFQKNSKSKISYQKIKEILPQIKENVLLKNYTTFKIGGPAKYFFIAKTKEDLKKAIILAKKINLPFFILGKGSNILISDKGYNGLVINFQFSNLKFQKNKIIAGGGISLGVLVNKSIKKGLTGLEWAIGIPGTLGGAIYGNAGAFGNTIADIVKSVEVLQILGFKNQKSKIKNYKFKIKKFKNKECQFSYRESVFKHKKNLIILSAELELKKAKKEEIKKKIFQYLDHRKKNQPLDFFSAGSIFKNPLGYSAGKLIEECNLKGERIGDAQISEKHANFIVNLGKAKASDVKKLINLIKKKVKKRFKINLEEEICYLDFKN